MGGGAKGESGSGKSSAPSTGSSNVRNSSPEWLECNFGLDKNVIELKLIAHVIREEMARLCKICSSDLSEDHKKRRLKTATSVRAELSQNEIVVDVCGDVSKTLDY